MYISSFSRMKSFCKAGRLSVILKLELPHIKDAAEYESNSVDSFNNFYLSLADAYQGLAAKTAEDFNEGSNPPSTLSVSFVNVTNEYKEKNIKKLKSVKEPLVIKRRVRINRAGNITTNEYIDVFDFDGGIFVN